MTPQSIVLDSASDTRKILKLVLTDLPDDAVTQKAHPSMLSISDAVSHLTECYLAYAAHVNGLQHEWGSYESPFESFSEAVDGMLAQRDAVTNLIPAEADEETLKTAMGYLVNHDWYHIGQIATNRQVFEPGWSSFSIYAE